MTQTQAAPRTAARLPQFAARRHGASPAMRFKRDGSWQERSYADVGAEVDRLAAGLVAHGIDAGDRVCILADTRPEWTVAANAIWGAGAVVVPIYPTNSPEECAWVLGNCGAVAVVVEDAAQLAKVDAVRGELPALRSILVMEPRDASGGVVALDALAPAAADAAEVERRRAAVTPDDPALIIYTSGTTGPPKGCVLSHRNAMAVCSIVLEIGTLLPGEVAYLFLPLAHVFAQIIQLAAYRVGAALAYYGGDTKEIIPELMEVHPDYLPSVPRIFEKLYALAMAQVPPEQLDDLRLAVQLGVRVRALQARGEPVPDELREPFERADERVFAKIRPLFGGNLREALTGAAPIAPEILEFFYAAGVPVMEGYGLTETMALGTVNLRDAFRFGTVGRALPGVEVRIADDDEILMRGPHVFTGYWGDEEATREVLDADGWLHTGDLGSLDEDGYLRITGRKKDIIITAGGKNLAPANIENDLKQSPFISQAVMYGDRRPYPVALVTLDAEAIVPWAQERGLPGDLRALAEHPEVRGLVQQALDAANARYAKVEQVKRFAILGHDLTQETGELTPTLKVKRNVVHDRYAGVFDGLYAR
ncbi:MAG TPA: AMP-dependent synthetase/ligase [Solirubrobacteraceae bacterium]|nr:AMP-dependent synthetase/ligase [Solirubrobacteraceae bacterium]